jgi:hypothetical protein
MPPSPSSPEALEALGSPTGKALMIWLALRDHGVSEAEAGEISDGLSEVERFIFQRALQTRRRTLLPREAETEADEDKGIEDTWCAGGMWKLVEKLGLDAFKLTLDQYEWMLREGDIEEENPNYAPEKLSEIQANMMAKWGDKLAALQIAPEPQVVRPPDATMESTADALVRMGLRIKPDEGPAV